VIGVSNRDPLAGYLREIRGYPLLTEEQERRLAEACRAGDSDARDQLIQANLRLVVSVARRYSDRGMSLLDLIQVGNLGLMKATESFDPSKGFKFSTYATWSIRKSIMDLFRRPPPDLR
jgi:RNA polymerase primary sigma factor